MKKIPTKFTWRKRNKPKVQVVRGELFEGGADLIVLPCSVKGTISTATKIAVKHFDLEKPEAFSSPLKLGATTESKSFPGSKSPARHYCYACSVFNDSSELNALENIGQELGILTEQDSSIVNIQSPLLGTGAGKISKKNSVLSLARGFRKTARINSTLQLFVSDHESEQELNKLLGSGVFTRLINSILLNPNIFGVGVNLKKILGLEK
jgi:stage V sporulation protein SpoVS